MKIAVIGIGNVGGTLGPAWAKAGHEVIFGVRNPDSEKVKTLLQKAGHKTRAASVPDAAAAAAIYLLSAEGMPARGGVLDLRAD